MSAWNLDLPSCPPTDDEQRLSPREPAAVANLSSPASDSTMIMSGKTTAAPVVDDATSEATSWCAWHRYICEGRDDGK